MTTLLHASLIVAGLAYLGLIVGLLLECLATARELARGRAMPYDPAAPEDRP